VGRRKLTFSKLLTDHPQCLAAELSVSSQDSFANWRLLTIDVGRRASSESRFVFANPRSAKSKASQGQSHAAILCDDVPSECEPVDTTTSSGALLQTGDYWVVKSKEAYSVAWPFSHLKETRKTVPFSTHLRAGGRQKLRKSGTQLRSTTATASFTGQEELHGN
jgi:hypothetical protein